MHVGAGRLSSELKVLKVDDVLEAMKIHRRMCNLQIDHTTKHETREEYKEYKAYGTHRGRLGSGRALYSFYTPYTHWHLKSEDAEESESPEVSGWWWVATHDTERQRAVQPYGTLPHRSVGPFTANPLHSSLGPPLHLFHCFVTFESLSCVWNICDTV